MNNHWQLAARLLFWRRDNRRLNWSAILSATGVGIGSSVLILSLSVLNGFQSDVEDTLLKFEGPGLLMPLNDGSDLEVAQQQLLAAGIETVPYAERNLVLQTGDEYRLVKARVVPNLDALRDRFGDSMITPKPYPGLSPKVVIGSLLADKLSIYPGDRVRLLSPLDVSLTSMNPPQTEAVIRSIYEIGLLDFDETYIFIDFETAQKLIPRITHFSGLALTAAAEASVIEAIINADEWILTTWRTKHAELIAAMELEKIGSAVVLFLIILVASFNATSTMVMSVMEKYRQIGILRSLGASRRFVINLFLKQGFLIGVVGVIIGATIGTSIALIQMETGFIPGPGRAYLQGLPMQLDWTDVTYVVVGTIALTLISAWYPARYAADIEPGLAVNYLK